MSVGAMVRGALGKFEPAAIRGYRGLFIDLDAVATTVASVVPEAKRILEIGCGDGAMAAALRRVLPTAEVLGLDPGVLTPGRMFEGDRTDVVFRPITSTELIEERPEPFDLTVICDVLHHVAEGDRLQVLNDAAELTAPGGTVALKEWEIRPGLGNSAAFLADRWISGDRTVRFMARPELDDLIGKAMPGWSVSSESHVPPRVANLLLTLRRPLLTASAAPADAGAAEVAALSRQLARVSWRRSSRTRRRSTRSTRRDCRSRSNRH